MNDHVVTGHGNGHVFPSLVATNRHQRAVLVDTLLHTPAAVLTDPRLHYSAYVYVSDTPTYNDPAYPAPDGAAAGSTVAAYLRVGVYQGYGGAFFGDHSGRAGADWAWVALAPHPTPEAPTVYFDQDTDTTFPPQAVMPLHQLHAVVLEWAQTGQQPRNVEWMPINALVWHVTDDGNVTVPPDRRSGYTRTR